MSSGLCDDCVGSEELFGEFLRRPSGTNVFGPDIDGISDLEVRGRSPMLVGLNPVTFLSLRDVVSEFAVKLIQVYGVFPSPCGGQIPLRMHGNIGMVPFVSVERRYSGGGVRSIVVCKFRER